MHIYMHAQIEGMSQTEVLSFYEFLARGVSDERAALITCLEHAVLATKAKHDRSLHISKAVSMSILIVLCS
jgi:hypothetical protein